MLNTIEVNQKALTASSSGVPWLWKVYCNVVAVTAEKKVDTVDKLRRLAAPCSCANRMVGTPAFKKTRFRPGEKQDRESEQTNLDKYTEGGCDGLYVFANFGYKIM